MHRWLIAGLLLASVAALGLLGDGITGHAAKRQDIPTGIITDPADCPGEIAHCYDIVLRNETPAGQRNVSTYRVPERRLRTYICIGNDTACVNRSVACSCPQIDARVPLRPYIAKGLMRCSDGQHLCRDSYATLTLCKGNLSSCIERYGDCGCGRYSACAASELNTCVDGNDRLILCAGTMSDCLGKYRSCFCANGALQYQQQCTTARHACVKDGRNATCYGPFAQCALRMDACAC